MNIKIAAPPQFFRKEMLMGNIKCGLKMDNEAVDNIVQEDPGEKLPAPGPSDRNIMGVNNKNISCFLFVQLNFVATFWLRYGGPRRRPITRSAPSWFQKRGRKR